MVSSDIVAILVSLLTGSLLRSYVFSNWRIPFHSDNLVAIVLLLCSLTAAGLYPGVNINPVDELRRSTYATTLGFFALWSGTFFLHDLSQSRFVFAFAYLFTLISVPLGRTATRTMLAGQPWWGSAVAILGYGVTGKYVHETLLRNPSIGLKPVAILDDDAAKHNHADPRVTFGTLKKCGEVTRNQRIPYGIVCMPSLSRDDLLRLVDSHGQCFGHLIVIPNLIGMTSLGISAKEVGGLIGLEVRQQLLRPFPRFIKRCLDLSLALLLAGPVAIILAIVAVLIKLEDGGPVLYGSGRLGFCGKKFTAWKLRSMVVDGETALQRHLDANPDEAQQWKEHQKLTRDPRITRIGRILRKTSIDEAPQLWNVLTGEMSIVGPRPILPNQVEMYGGGFPLYTQVRPGITGLWQVSGRNHLSFAERARLDKYVIQNWSVWLDLYILARTAKVVLFADGAY